MTAERIDLGLDHWLEYTTWNPDLPINPQYAHLADLIHAHPVCGAIVGHKCNTETGLYEGSISFRTPLTDAVPGFSEHPRWTVKSWDPIHLEPSLQSDCPCKDHGFIRGGKWVKA